LSVNRSQPHSFPAMVLENVWGIFDFAVSSNRRAVFMLVVVSLFAFLPGFFQIPPVDRDEPFLSQATKQMIESGDYVDPHFQHEVHYTKPVGIYWLQATMVQAAEALWISDARTRIWLYRLPSLFGAIGAVLATYWCALAFVKKPGATLAALMIAASPVLDLEARLARTDAVLLFTIVSAMAVLARAYLFPRNATIAQPGWVLITVFWTAFAAGILLKGLVIVMVIGLTAMTLALLDRSVRCVMALRPLYGAVLLAVLASPWLIMIYTRTGDAFFLKSVVHDTLGKITNAQEGHGGLPGYYVVLFYATFFPYSILAGLAAPAIWAKRHEPAVRFLLAWVVPSWMVFELSVTKLPHYTMPLYPAIAILIAGVIEANALSEHRWLKRGLLWWFVVPIVFSVAVISGAFLIGRVFVPLAWPFFAAAIACGFLAWRLYDKDRVERALLSATLASVLMGIGVYGFVIPALKSLFPSVALVATLRESDCPHPTAASDGYEEPSLVFLAGTNTTFTDASGAADFLRDGHCRFAFIKAQDETLFTKRAAAIELRYQRGPRVEAFNFSKGRPLTIDVFRSVDGQKLQ
jgi:4-amino-4-deoxy-L-arabinose transferase-like glycosyltransferase